MPIIWKRNIRKRHKTYTLRREASFRRDWKVGVRPAPIGPLIGNGVTVRLPHDEEDIAHLSRYRSDDSLLAGMWLGYPDPDVNRWAQRMVSEWREGWSLAGSDSGPALIIDAADPFVGVSNPFPQQERSIEMLYGVLPNAQVPNRSCADCLPAHSGVLARYRSFLGSGNCLHTI